jgi:16S rRNA (adenine1518-N6/adenine1519-N6)-dimethyltransferase
MRTGRTTGIHFLVDSELAKRIVSLADVRNKDVLEIGPGRGAITDHIKNYKRLYLIEKEKTFEAYLRNKFPDAILIMGDALRENWPPFDIFISNMPYKITSPLLEKLWSTDFQMAVITVQKEVADRLIAKPNSKDYSKLSIMMQLKFDIDKEFEIPPYKFSPPPKVQSTVLTLRKRSVKIDDGFPEFLKILFSQRRKKIKNIINIERFKDNRPEELTIEEILSLYYDFNGRK